MNRPTTDGVTRRITFDDWANERRFDPAETIIFPKTSFEPNLDEPTIKSLKLFIEQLSELESDHRIRTNVGRVELVDEFNDHTVIWILNVVDSIYMAVNRDQHISIRALAATPSGVFYTSRVACVFSGNLPVGDYLANVISMFHNGVMVDAINTLDDIRKEVLRSVTKAEIAESKEAEREAHRQAMLELERTHRERRAQMVAERTERESQLIQAGIPNLLGQDGHFWPNFYEQMIAQDVSMIVRKWALGELDIIDRDELAFAIDKLYELDCDTEPNFPAYQRDWLLRDLISAPICPNVRIKMINRLSDNDNDALRHLDPLRDELERGIGEHGDSDGLLLNATRDTIDRIRGRHYDRMFASARRRR